MPTCVTTTNGNTLYNKECLQRTHFLSLIFIILMFVIREQHGQQCSWG